MLPGSKSLGVSSAITQVPPISALIDSKQSSWVSVSHGPTQEKDPSAGTTGDQALAGVAVVAATSEDASRVNPRSKRLWPMLKGYKNFLALDNGLLSAENGYQCWFGSVSCLRPDFVEGVDRMVDI